MHLDPTIEQNRALSTPATLGRPMGRVRTVVARSNGSLQFIPLSELWEVSGILADTFPLDRSAARAPRAFRRGAHWSRLVLVDRAITNADATAIVTMSDTPWVPALAAAVVAGTLAPRLPVWARRIMFGATVAWALHERRLQRFVEMRRALGRFARDALLVGD